MTNQHNNVPVRVAMRQRREWLLSAIAGATLCSSWYLAAALDRYAQADSRPGQHTARTDFDAAFVAANRIDELAKVPCPDAACSMQLAQAETLKAQL